MADAPAEPRRAAVMAVASASASAMAMAMAMAAVAVAIARSECGPKCRTGAERRVDERTIGPNRGVGAERGFEAANGSA
ncbi:hypothetical protein WS91_19410 [Burkholderia sp. MSMB1498]|nr:hypothetical protein WS91_19410 [Burkholderia sp. MSMB1498]